MKDLSIQFFKSRFNVEPEKTFRCGGRFEILGNHTDHNHGLCIAATCSLATYASLRVRDDLTVDCLSKGMDEFCVDLNDLNVHEELFGQSSELIRGVAAYLVKEGYKIGGFDVTCVSNIAKGAGVSSSAAFEMLFAQIFNELFNDNKIELITLAKASQYAENVYFGKACGLLDQIATGFGGISFIDFKDIKNPIVKTYKNPYKDIDFIIVNSGGSHAGLSHLYKKIPDDMYSAAKKYGENYLRDVKDINYSLLNEDETLKAKHFYSENERINKVSSKLVEGCSDLLIENVNESSKSSQLNLKNTQIEGEYEGSPQQAIDRAKLICPKGGYKINGGGFAGSIICFVPKECSKHFINEMEKIYGTENVFLVDINDNRVGSI